VKSKNVFQRPYDIIWYENEERDKPKEFSYFFNPTILPIPGTKQFFVVARTWLPKYKMIDGEYANGSSGLVGCLLVLKTNGGLKQFECVTEPKQLQLDIPVDALMARYMRTHSLWNKFVGAEDPRLFFDASGLPMLEYGMNSAVASRARVVYLTDMRGLYEPLDRLINETCPDNQRTPLEYRQQELGSSVSDKAKLVGEIEKNWVPMTNDALGTLIQIHVNPRKIVRVNGSDLEELQGYEKFEVDQCLKRNFESLIAGRSIHQCANLVRVTLCQHGECAPDDDNTFYMQVLQAKRYENINYEHFVALWSIKAPGFKLHSIAGPLNMPGLNSNDLIYWNSMNYIHDEGKCPGDRGFDHGFLDSDLVLSMGVGDVTGKAIVVSPQDLLSQRYTCE
jgi:hypothetical protein